jgi:IS30 family transposase
VDAGARTGPAERLEPAGESCREASNVTAIARQIGKDRSTLSRELRRSSIEITPQDRFFNLRTTRFWSDEQLDAFLLTQPLEDRQTSIVYSHSDAQRAADNRAYAAQQKRRRKAPATRPG